MGGAEGPAWGDGQDAHCFVGRSRGYALDNAKQEAGHWVQLPHHNRNLLTDVRPAGHLAHRLFDILEVVDQSLLGLSEVGVIVFT